MIRATRCLAVAEDGKMTYYGHTDQGAEMAAEVSVAVTPRAGAGAGVPGGLSAADVWPSRAAAICALAVIILATMLLGIGDRTATLTLVSLCVLSLSAYVTDATGRFRLSQSAANWVALAIVGVSAVSASRLERHGKIESREKEIAVTLGKIST